MRSGRSTVRGLLSWFSDRYEARPSRLPSLVIRQHFEWVVADVKAVSVLVCDCEWASWRTEEADSLVFLRLFTAISTLRLTHSSSVNTHTNTHRIWCENVLSTYMLHMMCLRVHNKHGQSLHWCSQEVERYYSWHLCVCVCLYVGENTQCAAMQQWAVMVAIIHSENSHKLNWGWFFFYICMTG